MAMMQTLSGLALKHVIDGALKALGFMAGARAGESVVNFLGQRFGDHSARLSLALTRACDRAWKAVEVALAGDSWWDRLKSILVRGEEHAFRREVRAFLQTVPRGALPAESAAFRAAALRELRVARKDGLLDRGAIDPQTLAGQAGRFVAFDDPRERLREEWAALVLIVDELRQAGHPALAQLIEMRPGDGEPLLILAARYFFRREVESDRELFQGLTFAQLERISETQETGFATIAQAIATSTERVEAKIGDVQTTITETREVVVETQTVVVETQGAVAETRVEVARTREEVKEVREELHQVGQTVVVALDQHATAQRRAAVPDTTPAKSEQDIRLGLLNTLLKTPHRRLEEVQPLHAEMVRKDPLFYAHLAAWYFDRGDVRDHKEMFVVTLVTSEFEGHRDVGLALLRQLPPYEVARVVDFIHGTRAGDGATAETVRGLGRNLPRSLRTEVTRYLREREANRDWFDSTALIARKALKRLYALLHVAPGERAQQVLFDDRPPADSRVGGVKRLLKATTPEEQAAIVAEARLPFRVAVTVLPDVTPATLIALLERMSPQEVINSLSLLQRRGGFDHPDVKAMIDLKLEDAKKNVRVSAFKAEEALKAVAVDADTRRKLESVANERVKAKGRITRPTALLIDKSGSMELAIDVGKRIGAMISAVCERELYVYAFDKMAYPIQPKGADLASWHKAFQGIQANGLTACGVPLEMMRRKKQAVEQIILVTDEEEYDPPYFVESLLKYQRELGVTPAVCIVRVPDSSTRLQDQCKRAGIAVTTFEFRGDYYSLPNLIPLLSPPSELDLLLEVMDFPLPRRRPA